MKSSSTINDVSKESKVSTTTVSRVLNGLSKKYRISPETEALVMKTAQKLNYRPNLTAVNLRLRKSNTIGLVVPSLANPFFANMCSMMARELQHKGYSVMVTDCNEDEEIEAQVVNTLADRRIDGFLVSPSGKHFHHLENVYKRGIPVVCFDRYFENSIIPFVSSNNYQGAYDITRYLIEAGHKRIACILGTSHTSPVIHRLKGFKDAVSEAGVEFEAVGNGYTIENGYIETKVLLSKRQRPTAIFAFTDPIALGSLKALREEGLDVPGDVSLVTFDDAEHLNFLNPPITSVVQAVPEIARISIKILLEKIEGGDIGILTKQEKILLKPRIIHRSSIRSM